MKTASPTTYIVFLLCTIYHFIKQSFTIMFVSLGILDVLYINLSGFVCFVQMQLCLKWQMRIDTSLLIIKRKMKMGMVRTQQYPLDTEGIHKFSSFSMQSLLVAMLPFDYFFECVVLGKMEITRRLLHLNLLCISFVYYAYGEMGFIRL